MENNNETHEVGLVKLVGIGLAWGFALAVGMQVGFRAADAAVDAIRKTNKVKDKIEKTADAMEHDTIIENQGPDIIIPEK